MENGCSLAKFDVNSWKISLLGAYQSEKREGWWQPRVDIPILQEHRWRCRGLICRSVRLVKCDQFCDTARWNSCWCTSTWPARVPKNEVSCFTLGVWHNLLQPKYVGIMPKAEVGNTVITVRIFVRFGDFFITKSPTYLLDLWPWPSWSAESSMGILTSWNVFSCTKSR